MARAAASSSSSLPPSSQTVLSLPLLLFFLFSNVHATLPYNPTHLLQSRNGRRKTPTYVLEPPSPSAAKGKLLVLSPDSKLTANKIPAYTISKSLPFFENGTDTAITSSISSDGSISIYVGNCDQGSQKSSLWKFSPDKDHLWRGTWKRQSFSVSNVAADASLTGANWLASAVSFSSTVSDEDTIYVFGGMCPQDGSSIKDKSWISDASYSSQMLLFQPQQATGGQYSFSVPAGHGQPTPEAGFTITPLPPSYSRDVDGSQTQQQDFVLIGGHTQTAFIDMNLIALFSLPQASWTFLTVAGTNPKTDLLAARQESNFVDSRSGHSAVLTSDGQKIIVFGGWVGDVSTPAEPQAVVLEVGAGYGGSKSWRWSHLDGIPLETGSGIYGHGATLLPGGIMMVTGGFSISSHNRPSKRSLQTRNSQNYFLNTTSGRWLSSYHLGKAGFASISNVNDDSGPLSSTTEKAGLGAGLGFGLLAIICLIFFVVSYRRRLQLQREEDARLDAAEEVQEKGDDDYAPVGSYQGNFQNLGRTIDGRGGSTAASSLWGGDRANKSSNSPGAGRPVEKSGNDVLIPSPHRGLRRSMYGRQGPYTGARYDDNRYHWGSRDMHAIPERDEESSSTGSSRQVSTSHPKPITPGLSEDKENLNPFKDPEPPLPVAIPRKPIKRVPIGAYTSTEAEKGLPLSPAEERQREMDGWIKDWAAADAASRNNSMASAATGKSNRSSPSKSDRTNSNLSDRSNYSNTSARSGTGLIVHATNNANGTNGSEGPSRNTSSRSMIRNYLPNILPTIITNPFSSPSSSPSNTMTSSSDGHTAAVGLVLHPSRPNTASDSATNNGSGSSSSGETANDRDSFASAKSTFTHIQNESEALLALNNGLQPDSSPSFTRPNGASGGPIRFSNNRSSLVGGWVGTVRRGVVNALTATGVTRATSVAGETAGSRVTVIGSDGYYQHNTTAAAAPTGSPVKSEHERAGITLGLGRRNNSSSPSKKNRRSLPAGQERLSVLDHESGEKFTAGAEYTDERYDKDETSKPPMKRSVSEGAAFWAAKQGAKDWETDLPPSPNARKRTSTGPLPLSDASTTREGASQNPNEGASVGWRNEGAWKSKHNADTSFASSTSTSFKQGHSPDTPSQLNVVGPRRVNSRHRGPNLSSNLSTRSTSNPDQTLTNNAVTGDASSDWDVEAAVEQRVVQVMFTVPRERLRVVNADVDVSSLVSTLRDDADGDAASAVDGASIISYGEDTLLPDPNDGDWKNAAAETIMEDIEEEKKAEADSATR